MRRLALMSSAALAIGSQEKTAQLVRHAVACRRLHARNERQRNYCAYDRRSSSDICADATRRLGLFQIPDSGLVGGFLLPPPETDATGAARGRAASQAAAAVDLARAAVEPDYITHAARRDLVRD